MALIDPSRLVDWTPGTHVGVPGGIPARDDSGKIINMVTTYGIDNTGATSVNAAITVAMAIEVPNLVPPDYRVFYFPTGTYKITGAISVPYYYDCISFRGDGPGLTIFQCVGEAGLVTMGSGASGTPRTNITAGLAKGATQITVADAAGSGLTEGECMILEFECDFTLPMIQFRGSGFNGGYGEPVWSQIVKITNTTGNVVDFFPPLYDDYGGGSLVAKARYITTTNPQAVQGVGIEDLEIAGSPENSNAVAVVMTGFGNWMKNVYCHDFAGFMVQLAGCLQCEVRHCDFRGGTHMGHPVFALSYACANLIEDCIMADAYPHYEVNFSSCGNAFLYNFHKNALGGEACNINHSPHSFCNLYEGSSTPNTAGFRADNFHGSSAKHTIFRNNIGGKVGFHLFTRESNIVGNIMEITPAYGLPKLNTDFVGHASLINADPWADWPYRLVQPGTISTGARMEVLSITRSGATATVTTDGSHGFSTGHLVDILGAVQTEYNYPVAEITVTGASTFTYQVTGSPATPATVNTGGGYTAILARSCMVFSTDAVFVADQVYRASWTPNPDHAMWVNVEVNEEGYPGFPSGSKSVGQLFDEKMYQFFDDHTVAVRSGQLAGLTDARFKICGTTIGDSFAFGELDDDVEGTTTDKGNWCVGTGLFSTLGGDPLPDSLAYTAQPDWWPGGFAWPPFDPEVFQPTVFPNDYRALIIGYGTLTSSGTTATFAYDAYEHGWSTGFTVRVEGADQPNYNGDFVITVLTTKSFSYTMVGTAVSPATGTITQDTVSHIEAYEAAARLLPAGARFLGDAAPTGTVSTPTFSPVAGSYDTSQNVTITSSTGGATIRYTTNGTTPTNSVGTVYSTPVSITSTTTLKAIAYNGVDEDSAVRTGTYTLKVAAPSFSPVGGSYGSTQNVTISSTTAGATIRYTVNGATPTNSVGTVYSGPVSISSTATLKAIAYNGTITDSDVTTGVYAISASGTLVVSGTFSATTIIFS